jgi:ribosomal protein S18 acetylase RimI-like enzyme
MTNARCTVRPAQAEDVAAIYRMLRESAAAQGSVEELCVDAENLREDGFERTPPRFRCLLAEVDGQPAGLALCFFPYSTWTSRMAVYLEDLYVAPEFRRHGVARVLMTELAKIAVDAGCLFIRWLVLRENAAALAFYDSIGAEVSEGWASMRLEREHLLRLAKQG